ncbi:DUF5330 domain-containing protein [Chelativorans xinjiangense]|uniref:DUF5330 domain-containing protein n=1 Tax=Chelativorans xinjiangense TaxID=2681485 RepID=UPI00135C4D2B|nr:DUF5330 domain-containing protein [Chelativorans xinjiangense]
MGFLIRCAFWLSLVLLFIPLNTGEGPEAEQVGPLQALVAARDAVRDVAGICGRQPDVCATAKTAVHTITARAREGMRIAQGLIDDEAVPQADMVEEPREEPQVTATGSIAPAE